MPRTGLDKELAVPAAPNKVRDARQIYGRPFPAHRSSSTKSDG